MESKTSTIMTNIINATNNVKDGVATTTKPNILTIPPEIRLLIFEAYLAKFKFSKSKPQPAIIFTCKLMHEEALAPYEVRLRIDHEERRAKLERANEALQHRIDNCTVQLERLQLSIEQIDLELQGWAGITDIGIEISRVYQMKLGVRFKQP